MNTIFFEQQVYKKKISYYKKIVKKKVFEVF